jgi:hypothetical protein
MLITPFYLMRLGGIYNMEPIKNFHWGLMSLAFMRLYHYLVLQPISFATQINLNSMMCPAISDPFTGPWYRIAANLHQTFFIVLHGKLYCILGDMFFVPKHEKRLIVAKTAHSQTLDANGNNIEYDKKPACNSCAGDTTPEEKLVKQE